LFNKGVKNVVNELWGDVIHKVNFLDNPAQAQLAGFRPVGNNTDRQRFSVELNGQSVLITLREKETLQWIVNGLTVPQAAKKMNLSPRTVEFYVKTLRYKFQCMSKRLLIQYILEHDILANLKVCYY
jgi:DNA-binding CsgD family transcriptional regulator